ncbi:hypothetical protein [Paraburkholderia aromaticivorans]|uniref:hypothetical protein n=1 Tax=Paraburkholderia aromaticivorans TaxID=2026199 RepID=UPI00145600FA|nr:hypothetical protein [Paraburkholderia aromaticivorans]
MKNPNLSSHFATDEGALAARRLFEVCRYDDSDVEIIANFLVSLHNHQVAAPDLYLICRSTDDNCFRDVVKVMKLFREVDERCDLHEILGAAGKAVLADLILRFGLAEQPTFLPSNKCERIPAIRRGRLLQEQAAQQLAILLSYTFCTRPVGAEFVPLTGGLVFEMTYSDCAVVVTLVFFAGVALGRLRGLVRDGRR